MASPESKPTLADLLDQHASSRADASRGPIHGVVVSYDRARQRADVEVPVHVLVDGEARPLPVLRSVPVVWPSGGSGSLTIDLEAGDPVYLVPSECDCSAWIARGLRGPPPTRRRGSASDYVAIPGGARLESLSQFDEGAVVLAGADVRLGDATASDYVALASLVLAELQAIRSWCELHTHVEGAASLPPLGPLGNIAARTVKAK